MPELSNVQSMTGHAIVERKIGATTYRFQIKSVNHRFIELKFKAPRAWSALEISVKQLAQAKLRRGSVEIWIEKSQSGSAAAGDSSAAVQNLFAEMEKALKGVNGVSQFLIPAPIRALILSRYPDIWQKDATEETWNEAIEKDVMLAFGDLVAELVKKRHAEGMALLEVLKAILQQLTARLKILEEKLPESRQAWEEKIRARFKELANELQMTTLPEDRIYAEFLILAEKRDVAEEMDRIKIHLTTLSELLTQGDAHMGKRLDFLMQELHREWTTLGNKIQNATLAPVVMDAKLGLEQIREQIQNLI